MPPKFSKELEEKVITTRGLKVQTRTSPCEINCPAGNPIQKVHALIKEERMDEALAYLRSRNPFPGITGRVCAHPCERDCNRNHYDEGISIRSLERYAADRADMSRVGTPKKMEATGKRLAVIGSGPAGMTCAYFSALFGHEVTVFESSAVLGGMPRSGIPGFRLPKDVVDREIGRILELGVRAKTNTTIGRDIGFEEMRKDFDGCLIAVGTWRERIPDIQGHEAAEAGVSFLKRVNLGLVRETGQTVAIIGGGGVAFDCAFTAKRLGAKEIHIFCVEGEGNMCASPEDLRQAEAEGIIVHHSRTVSKLLAEGGKITGLESYAVSSFEFDERGALHVQPASDERSVMEADSVILAAGVEPDFNLLQDQGLIEFTPKGALAVNPDTLSTSLEGVFGAGDAVLGPSSVARAIGSGRQAALCIDRYLRGDAEDREIGQVSIDPDDRVVFDRDAEGMTPHMVTFEEILNVDAHEKGGRPQTAGGAASLSFEETDKGLERAQALAEADRCFHCGHCTSCGCCVENCPGFVLEMAALGPRVAHFDECWHCGCCRIACPSGAVSYEFPLNMMV